MGTQLPHGPACGRRMALGVEGLDTKALPGAVGPPLGQYLDAAVTAAGHEPGNDRRSACRDQRFSSVSSAQRLMSCSSRQRSRELPKTTSWPTRSCHNPSSMRF